MRGRSVALFALACGALAPCDANAWGVVAHRAASIVAEARLTPVSRAAVRDLLDPGETLADASLWADEHRRDVAGSAAWHYVNVPIAESHYDPRYCPASGCVVSKIEDLRHTLADASAPREERRLALRFLVHFVEDLHQPLHVGDRGDRGGNDLQVRFFERGTNLHRLWDEQIIERHSADESAWAGELAALAKRGGAGWARGGPETWADESLAAAKKAYSLPGSGASIQPGAELGAEYYEAALPVATQRLAQAAVRLASTLNEIFQSGRSRDPRLR